MLGKIIGWVVVIVLIVFAITNPHVAGHDAHTIVTGIFGFFGSAANG